MADKIILHAFAPQDRSSRVRWTLEELNVPYESRFIDWEKKEHESPAFLKINPMGRVPAMEWNGKSYHESTALCLMLVDKFEGGLAPPPRSPLRGEYYQWCIFPAASIEPRYAKIWAAKEEDKQKAREELVAEAGYLLRTLEQALEGKDYLVGNEFSTADILLASCLNWAGGPLLKASPRLQAYFDQMIARPACVRSKAFAED